MTRVPERLPAPLSERLSLASQAIYSRLGREVDVAIGGIPFMLATSGEVQQSIETIPVRKEQLDTERDPGEQSLSGWWRRSQSSFHQGAGFRYEPDTADPHFGFWDSEGVDVFEPGDVTLLPNVERASTSAWTRLRSYVVNGTRTNACTNPSAETDTTGWSSIDTTITRDTAQSFAGSASVKSVATGGATAKALAPTFTATVGATYIVSAYVYVPSGHPDVFLAISGFTDFIGPTVTAKDQWVRVSETSTATTTTPRLQIHSSAPATAGDTFYVDAVLYEDGGILGSYFDGNSAGGSWTGTAELSASTLTISSGGRKWSGVRGGELVFDGPSGTDEHAPVGKTIVDGMVTGANFYSIASDGTLYQGSTSDPGSATSWPCGSAATRMAWAKHRLWVIGGRRLWQPDLSLAGGAAQNPVFIHPNLGWTYTCMAEGPAAMFFGGHDGTVSNIQAITLDAGGGLPTLSGAATSAALPDGELVQELAVIAGQFIGIGTTSGFRVGVMDGSTITYGPIMLAPEGVVSTTALIADGRFFLVTFETGDGLSQVYKVDTSVELAEGVYAYAKDMQAAITTGSNVDPNQGTVVSLAILGNDVEGERSRILAATTLGGLFQEAPSARRVTGWLETSRIRFRTTEKKIYRFMDMDIEPLAGAIQVEAILEGGSTLPVGNITETGSVLSDLLSINSEPMRYLSLRFELARGGTSETPTIHSYQLNALPAVAPQRLITLPLLCYDDEQARSGQRYGTDGYCQDRLTALQLLEDAAVPLVFQDYTTGSDVGQTVVIEGIRFVQMTPGNADSGNRGGILYLQLRTVNV
jgi:hypothetical protein